MPRIVKKAEDRKKEIVKAARQLFLEKGQKNLTMQGLMTELNIAKGTIYHHFSSKEEILEAIVEDLVDEELEKKQALLSSPQVRGLDALEKLKRLVTDDTLAEDNEAILEALHHHENAHMHAKQLGRYLIKLAPVFASVIEEGCKQGLFSTPCPLECAELMLAGVQFLTDQGFYPWEASDLERRMNAFPSLLESLLNAPCGAFDFLKER
ncbi:TetR/AcrR family transcriptional regulator [Desulfatiferula olefinivorans]